MSVVFDATLHGVGAGVGVGVGVAVGVGVGVGVAVGVGVSVGVGVAVGVGVGVGVPPHRALMFAAWKVLAARKVKSTGSAGLIGINVTTTGINVPGVNAGIITTALICVPTTVSDCKPVPALT